MPSDAAPWENNKRVFSHFSTAFLGFEFFSHKITSRLNVIVEKKKTRHRHSD